ncbi:MAG: D-alanine--D-alanine ligase [Thermoleophilia bacterium]|nr:D-alanine--D-alanine ligase [Thermoleophilia bacterium]
MRKIHVAVLAGGRSSEHDISRLSAMSIIGALDPERYEPVAVLIERSGDWRLTSPAKLALHGTPQADPSSGLAHDRALSASSSSGGSPARVRSETRPATVTSPSTALRGVDVIFPVLHGSFGEDGTIQGLLETAGVPYVGAGVLASAVGMDKAIFKAILRDAGIPVAPGVVAHAQRTDLTELVATVANDYGFPVFVKPARMGSSIGISRASNEAELLTALELAFEHDSKVLVEQAIEGVEVEVGVLGNHEPIVSIPGEVVIADGAEWYDFNTKYLEGGMRLEVPARISPEATARVQDVALQVFHAIDCAGLARIDCFVTPAGDVVVNEVNTMPGFTATSAYAKLFEASGHSYNAIVDRLIVLAIDRHREQSELRH